MRRCKVTFTSKGDRPQKKSTLDLEFPDSRIVIKFVCVSDTVCFSSQVFCKYFLYYFLHFQALNILVLFIYFIELRIRPRASPIRQVIYH